VIPYGDKHISPSLIHLESGFSTTSPGDGFTVLSIHCAVEGLGASFLHKCPASLGNFLRQHGLLGKCIMTKI